MSASGSTHTFAKRGLALEPPLIAGITVVVLLFNMILAVSFCLLRNRRKLKNHKRRVSASVDPEKCETNVALVVTADIVPAAFPAKAAPGLERKSYFELVQTLQRQPGVPSPTRLSRGSSHSSTDSTRRLSRYVLRPHDIKGLDGAPRYPKTKGRLQALRQSATVVPTGKVALTRSNSFADTASVYSSASAPLEYHEQLFRTQPFALDPSPPASAPAWMSQLPNPPAPAVISGAPEDDKKMAVFESFAPSQEPASTLQIPEIGRRPSHPDVPVSPSIIPSSAASTSSAVHYRARANSNPHSPPRIEWLSPKMSTVSDMPSPRETNSQSSLSTMYSLHEVARVFPIRPVPIIPVMPLNVKRRSDDLQQAGRADSSQVSPSGSAAALLSVPARSPRRPASSGSPGRLP